MQVFAKVFLIMLIIKNAKGELKYCDNENVKCNTSKILPSESETTDLSSIAQRVVQYFHHLNQRYENLIRSVAVDINDIKKSLQSDSVKHTNNCSYTHQPLAVASIKEFETITEASPSLYGNLWVIIQRRQDGSVSFYRHWYHYKQGFGNPFREFFIGLDKIHYLTNSAPHELLIRLEDFKGNIKYALYDEFLVGDESEKYQLKKLGNYSGTAGDYLRDHEGMYFSTKDKDNDASNNLHCAKRYQGGWWYNNCLTSNLNGPFRTRYVVSNVGITWGKPGDSPIKIVQIMLRSKAKEMY